MARRCIALMLLGAFLLQLARVGAQIVEEELTEEQIEYYRSVLETYDTNHDGFISMEENLEQDKIIAEESGKPFDEVSPAPPAAPPSCLAAIRAPNHQRCSCREEWMGVLVRPHC